ncbi:MAG: crosslink repair DNA glycosylase YcaQ family protein [Thermomicrobiales bacterium]
MPLRHESLGFAGAVRRVVALRAQQAGSPYLAPWNRLTGFDPAGLDAAFAGHEVVKATQMRITSHSVHAGDYRAFREVMEPTPRAARLDDRFRASGLSVADAHSLVPDLPGYAGRTRTAAEMKT